MTKRNLETEQDSRATKQQKLQGSNPLYANLHTIDRNALTFLRKKQCSLTLATNNIYSCLVCGVYLQGRSKSTPLYTHCLDASHYLSINLETGKIYVLPENVELSEQFFADIQHSLDPVFTQESIKELDEGVLRSENERKWTVGYLGIGNTGWSGVNVVVQALAHITPLRDYFLLKKEDSATVNPALKKEKELARCFGQVVRQMWNPRGLRPHISPIEFVEVPICPL